MAEDREYWLRKVYDLGQEIERLKLALARTLTRETHDKEQIAELETQLMNTGGDAACEIARQRDRITELEVEIAKLKKDLATPLFHPKGGYGQFEGK